MALNAIELISEQTNLQYLGQFLAGFELQRGLVDAVVAASELLRLLLQGTLEVEALETGLILGHQQHLSKSKSMCCTIVTCTSQPREHSAQ